MEFILFLSILLSYFHVFAAILQYNRCSIMHKIHFASLWECMLAHRSIKTPSDIQQHRQPVVLIELATAVRMTCTMHKRMHLASSAHKFS